MFRKQISGYVLVVINVYVCVRKMNEMWSKLEKYQHGSKQCEKKRD